MDQGKLRISRTRLLEQILRCRCVELTHLGESSSIKPRSLAIDGQRCKHGRFVISCEAGNFKPVSEFVAKTLNDVKKILSAANFGDFSQDLTRLRVLHSHVDPDLPSIRATDDRVGTEHKQITA